MHPRLFTPLLALAASAILVACAGNGSAAPGDGTTPPPATATTAPTRPAPSPTVPPSLGPTGITALDRTILTIATRDMAAIGALVKLTPMACATEINGLGGPPRCEAGEANGTTVQVFPWSSCEGQYARSGQPLGEVLAAAFSAPNLSPVAVVKIAGVNKLGAIPGDAYGIIIANPNSIADVLIAVDGEGKITRVYRGCTARAQELIDRAGGAPAVIFPR